MQTAVPKTAQEAAERLQTVKLPGSIVGVLRTLQQAGHAGVLVGGTVRDCLLEDHGRGDWDVATSATPDEVAQLFRRTIPTGVQHGTVTVLVGAEGRSESVEVTTFRGEGAYEDGRRPTEVRFHRDLHADLERRDFTINAFAWDPLSATFIDDFGGLHDLAAGIVRAVGDPVARFREDGLRTMRAVRFCATLQFSLDPSTRAAIPDALEVFDRVSAERVRVELWKLLAAQRPSLGLVPMSQTGLWNRLLPPVEGSLDGLVARIDAMSANPLVRLARLLRGLSGSPPGELEAAVDRFRPSRAERRQLLGLLGPGLPALERAEDPVAIRTAAAELGRDLVPLALEVLDARADRSRAILDACRDVPLAIQELSIKGADLIAAGLVTPGPTVGTILRRLLRAVWVAPNLNDRDALLREAQRYVDPV